MNRKDKITAPVGQTYCESQYRITATGAVLLLLLLLLLCLLIPSSTILSAIVFPKIPLVKYDGSCLMKWQSTRLADMTHLVSDILNNYAQPHGQSTVVVSLVCPGL